MSRQIDHSGKTFGTLHLDFRVPYSEYPSYSCSCTCGKTVIKPYAYFAGAKKPNCGDIVHREIKNDLTGEQIGHIKVIKVSDKRRNPRERLYDCLCTACGKTFSRTSSSLFRTKRLPNYGNCGCIARQNTSERNREMGKKGVFRAGRGIGSKMNYKLTSEEKELVEKWYPRLIIGVLNQKMGKGKWTEEDVQAGSLGLISAAHHFTDYLERTPINPILFTTFAWKEISKFVFSAKGSYRKDVTDYRKIEKTRNLYYQRTGRQMPDHELADFLGIDVFEVKDITIANNRILMEQQGRHVTLDVPVSSGDEEGLTLMDFIPDKKTKTPFENACIIEESSKLIVENEKNASRAVKKAEILILKNEIKNSETGC